MMMPCNITGIVKKFLVMESKQHIKRMREFVLCLGNSVMKFYPEYNLTQKELEQIGWAYPFLSASAESCPVIMIKGILFSVFFAFR